MLVFFIKIKKYSLIHNHFCIVWFWADLPLNTLKKTLFVMETVATEDYIPYESDLKESSTVKSISIPQIQNSL